ncbi:hypothetical protein LPB140_08065 [Sphingorhabdus lutea]|uniref:DUF817 domain-containing protein n=2 Tax=Sphingorhabdus lutea TaxID=1913578 RepID=A0A1L3JEZ4_9SPHN|nr:DUF817 domain-containing protein [Sphingorhabdus lutea]APG63707.1 hypothetical protein LPB140_08065 [Sphingorhabdus lutea]
MMHSRFYQIRLVLEEYSPSGKWQSWIFEFLLFGFKQAWACLFGGLLLGLILLTYFLYPENIPIARYDFLVVMAVAIQISLILFRLETIAEARIILIFHIVGTVMEIFKTAHGSWVYPENGYLKIMNVPLFSGFMYAAVGSYIARIWRIFNMRFSHYPSMAITYIIAMLIYINFFTHHYFYDVRYFLFAVIIFIYLKCFVYFKVLREYRKMPLLLGLLLVALFIWFAENIATFAGAWAYPNQTKIWQMVSIDKLGAWFLLMYISFILVSIIQKPSPPQIYAE